MAEEVIVKIKKCIKENQNFVLEAGAGAGKTHALMESIDYLQNSFYSESNISPQILCITYTNVAKDEINNRLTKNNNIIVNTMHEFLWDFIKQYQIELIKIVMILIEEEKNKLNDEINKAQQILAKPRKNTNIKDKQELIQRNTERLEKYSNLKITNISYESYRALYKGIISHDDILEIAIRCLHNATFSNILINSFTHIFIDEFQDTNPAILTHLLHTISKIKEQNNNYIVVGLFGDEMQRIYSNTPLAINFEVFKFISIPKLENYRTCEKIIKANNILRSDGLIQEFKNNDIKFERLQFVYNLSSDKYLKNNSEIDLQIYKRLFLSHRQIAEELGFETISQVFTNEYNRHSNDKLLKMEDSFISLIINNVIYILYEFNRQNYMPLINKINTQFFNMNSFNKIKGSIHDMFNDNYRLSSILERLISLNIDINSNKIEKIIADYKERLRGEFIENLLNTRLKEYLQLFKQINNDTNLQTLHGVKGAEFDKVLININAGQLWNTYNFDKLFLNGLDGSASVANAHKLFYVACTRAKSSLVINYITENGDVKLRDKVSENVKKLFGGLIEIKSLS